MTGRRRGGDHVSPVELRFIDLFMLIVAALVFVAIVALLISATPTTTDALEIRNRSLPVAWEGETYEIYLSGDGGEPPYRWTVRAREVSDTRTLPPGLNFDAPSGWLHGIPDTYGTTILDVVLFDTAGLSVTAELSLLIHPIAGEAAFRIVGPSAALPEAVTSTLYRHQLAALDGEQPYKFTVVDGSPPPGIRLTADGVLQGRLKMDAHDKRLRAPFRFSVVVSDAKGNTAEQQYVLPVRYQADRGWPMSLLMGGLGAIWWFLRRVVGPAVLVGLAGVIVQAIVGHRSGVARRRRGLLRREW